jgi:hypothetical protein
MLLICDDERTFESLSEADLAKRHQGWATLTQELIATEKMRGGDRLRPAASATTLRIKNGQRLLSDGPFAETKEQLGGYYVVEADNLDEAVEWASKMPHLEGGGSVEIRPIWPME